MAATFNPYLIGVRFVLHDGLSHGLAAIAGHFLGLHRHIGETTQAIRGFQAALLGAGAAWVGFAGIKGMKHMVDDAGKFLAIQNQMLAGGWKQAELEKAVAASWRLSHKYRTISAETILEMQKELAPVLGDREKALQKAEFMAGMQASMQLPLGVEKAAQFTKQIRDAIRAGELAGEALQPERFAQYMDSMVKVLNAFGGTITPTDFFMATKYGRASAINWSDDFRERILPTLMQELGASSTGTALMSLYQAVVGGTMRRRSLNTALDLGLIDSNKLQPGDITPEGRIKHMKPGLLKGSRLLMENPYEWVQTVLRDAMLQRGIVTPEEMAEIDRGNIKDGIGKEARKKLTEKIALLFGNRTAQGMVDMLMLQKVKIDRDARLIGDAKSIGETLGISEKDYQIQKKALHDQWENFKIAIGMGQIGPAVEGLKMITNAITALTAAATKDPGAVKALTAGLVTFFGAMIVGGTMALASAVLGPFLIPVLIGSLATIIGTYVALNWAMIKAKISEGMEKAGDWLSSTWQSIDTAMKQIGQRIGEAIMSIPGMVASAIASFASDLASSIGNAIKRALGFGGKGAPEGPGPSTMEGFHPQSWVPPSRGGGMIQASTQIHLDGRVLAQAVAHHIAEDAHFVSAGAGYDGHMSPVPVDYVPA